MGVLAAGGPVPARPETLDRVVASIGNLAITAQDVEQEYRFERFLDAQWPPPPPDAAAIAAARQSLTYQILLTREENPGPDDRAQGQKAATERLAGLKKLYTSPEGFSQTLRGLGMTEAEVLARLAREELVLRLVDERLRPAAAPSEQEVTEYYRSTFVPEFQKRNPGAAAPPLSDVEAQIREILVQKRINELLDQWVEELMPTHNVRFHSF